MDRKRLYITHRSNPDCLKRHLGPNLWRNARAGATLGDIGEIHVKTMVCDIAPDLDDNAGRVCRRPRPRSACTDVSSTTLELGSCAEATTLTTNLLPKLSQHRPWGRDVASTGSPCRATPSLTNIS